MLEPVAERRLGRTPVPALVVRHRLDPEAAEPRRDQVPDVQQGGQAVDEQGAIRASRATSDVRPDAVGPNLLRACGVRCAGHGDEGIAAGTSCMLRLCCRGSNRWPRKVPRVRDARTDDTEGRQARRAHRDDERRPTGAAASGYRGGYVLKADEGDDVVVAVMYDDKDAYFAMVHDPQTDENFGKIMELLEGEPTWTDGRVARPGGLTTGVPDAAHASERRTGRLNGRSGHLREASAWPTRCRTSSMASGSTRATASASTSSTRRPAR